MKLPPYIKALPSFFTTTPILKRYQGMLFVQTVYFQKEIYENLRSERPDYKNIGYLVHEESHYRRMKKKGVINFGVFYLLSKKERLNEELTAYGAQMKYLKSHKQLFNIERVAHNLSSWSYLWCSSYEEAKEKLDKMWKNS